MYVLSGVYVHGHLKDIAYQNDAHIVSRYGCLERSTGRGHEQPANYSVVHKSVGPTDPSRVVHCASGGVGACVDALDKI
jgi:hypothetical protein